MRRDEICNDILVLVMKGLMYHSLACLFYNLVSEKTLQMNLQLLVLFLPLFLFAVIRRKCGKLFAFILFHVLVSGTILLFFRGIEERMIIGGGTALMAAISLYIRLRDGNVEEECPPVSSVALFFILYLTAGQINRIQVMQFCYYEVFLFLILFAIYKNFASTMVFLKTNDRIENLPAKQIRGMNRMLLCIFILFLIGGMLFIPYLPVGSLLHGAGQILLTLLRGIIMFLAWIFERKKPHIESFGERIEETVPSLEVGEPSMLMQIFEKIFMTAVDVLLVAGAAYLLVWILYELYRRFYEQNKNSADESEFIWENPVVKIRSERKKLIKEMFAGRSVNKKIRHLYKKSIQKQFSPKADIPAALTLTELEQLIAQEHVEEPEKAEKRIMLYHKARYSQYECEKQELEVMKQSLGQNGIKIKRN